ncbi:MAG: cytochrome c5 family protein [Gammaproteobacteria bacterium]
MKIFKLALVCSALAVAGCGDKNDAQDTSKAEAPYNVQPQIATEGAADTRSPTDTTIGAMGEPSVADDRAEATDSASDIDQTTAMSMDESPADIAPAAGADATAGMDLAQGKTVYEGKCQACHATGAAGAPKLGDTANWAPRIAQGMDVLVKHSIEGFKGSVGFMPPKGGFISLSDDEVKAAVAYMVSQSQ